MTTVDDAAEVLRNTLWDPPSRHDVWEWAVGGSTGAGVRVGVVDSGVDGDHPAVGGLTGAVAVELDPDDPTVARPTRVGIGDANGHGTACAGVIRLLAPDVEVYSIKVLDEEKRGTWPAVSTGLRWALDADLDVVNLSLCSPNRDQLPLFHELAERAAFANTMVVGSMANDGGVSIPSEFSSVFSVVASETDDPWHLGHRRGGPGEWSARGAEVVVPWLDGGWVSTGGNSFAAPHVAAFVALVLAKHPDLSAFQVKTVLAAMAEPV
jgi:subtilisin family serine protease